MTSLKNMLLAPVAMVPTSVGRWIRICLLPAFVTSIATAAVAQSSADTSVGKEIYQAYCAACHGKNLEGASATKLVKTDWLFGRDAFSISNNIQNGIPSEGMPAWGNVLTEEESDQLLAFIFAAQTGTPWIADLIPNEIKTEHYMLRAERLIEKDISAPWGIEFIDNRTAIITENSGALHWMVDGKIDPQPIMGVPQVDTATSTGGLLDVAVDPDYVRNGWVYLALSHSENPIDRNSPGLTRIIRGRVKEHRWVDTEYLFRLDDSFHLGNSKHWGGRLLFDKQGYLYFSIGDMSVPLNSQDLSKPSGKIYRILRDGSVPQDNPFVSTAGALGATFSYGNRNAQGLAQHPVTGEIWATEHGPQGGDELNIIRKGRNYGWPLITYGINYDGSIISDDTHKEGMEQPVIEWTPAPAVSAIDFSTSKLFPAWSNNLFMGTLSREELRRYVIKDDKIIGAEVIFKGYGRIRDVKFGPDGALYVLLNNPGTVVRLTPQN